MSEELGTEVVNSESWKHTEIQEAIQKDETINRFTEPVPFPKTGVSISQFDAFIEICGGRQALENCTTDDVCHTYLKPLTSDRQSSYCDLIGSQGAKDIGVANVFCSHAWKYKFLDVVDALKYHFRGMDPLIWFDLFSNNQHLGPTLDFGWWTSTFKSAIASFRHTILILAPWEDPIPLTRAWCLYEIFCTIDTESKFEIAMCETEQNKFIEAVTADFSSINKMIATVDARKSTAWNLADKDRIFEVVTQTVGFDNVNSAVFQLLRNWLTSTISMRINHAVECNVGGDFANKLCISLAKIYREQGLFSLAEPLLRQATERTSAISGVESVEYVTILEEMALLLYQQGLYLKAHELYASCLSSRIHIFEQPKTTANVVLCSAFVGNCLYNQGNTVEAKKLFESILSDCYSDFEAIRLDRESDFEVLHLCGNLNSLLGDSDSIIKAEEAYLECLKLRSDLLGPEHPKTMRTMNDLVVLLMKKNEFGRALELMEVVVSVRRVKLGLYTSDTLLSTYNLAVCKFMLGKKSAANELFLQCVTIGSIVLGPDHSLLKEWKRGVLATTTKDTDLQLDARTEIGQPVASNGFTWSDIDLSGIDLLTRSVGYEMNSLVLSARLRKAMYFEKFGVCSEVALRLFVIGKYDIHDVDRMCQKLKTLCESITGDLIVPILATLPCNLLPIEVISLLREKMHIRVNEMVACVVSPFYPKGNIHQYFSSNIEPSISIEPWKYEVLLSLAKIINQLHNLEIVHGRLFPWNVLLKSHSSVAVADCLMVSPAAFEGTNANTVCAKSAEIQKMFLYKSVGGRMHESDEALSKDDDMYAFGVIGIGLLSGKDPSVEMFRKCRGIMQMIRYVPKIDDLPAACHQDIRDMIGLCLSGSASSDAVVSQLESFCMLNATAQDLNSSDIMPK